MHRKIDFRFTAMMRSNVSSETSANGSRSNSMAAPFTAQCRPPKASTVLVTRRLDGPRVGDVDGDEAGIAARRADHLGRLVAAISGDVRDRDACTLGGERDGDRPTHATRGAGHDRHLVGQDRVAHGTPRFLISGTATLRTLTGRQATLRLERSDPCSPDSMNIRCTRSRSRSPAWPAAIRSGTTATTCA